MAFKSDAHRRWWFANRDNLPTESQRKQAYDRIPKDNGQKWSEFEQESKQRDRQRK